MKILSMALLLALAAAAPAGAHAYYVSSSPAAGAHLGAPPALLTIDFSEELSVPFCRIVVTDQAGHQVQHGQALAVPGHADELQIPLGISAPGLYTVSWHALSQDGHRTKGQFSFTLGAP